MAVASQCLFPRAKFMKIMVYNLVSTCTSAALCCLAVFSAVKARQLTTLPGGNLEDYNSSACAVSGVWLLFAIWSVFLPPLILNESLSNQDIKHSPRLQTTRAPRSYGGLCDICRDHVDACTSSSVGHHWLGFHKGTSLGISVRIYHRNRSFTPYSAYHKQAQLLYGDTEICCNHRGHTRSAERPCTSSS
jgi:hypothetical protein